MDDGNGKMKSRLYLILTTVLAVMLFNCTEPESPKPPTVETIKILAPTTGSTFKLTDTVRIIMESDYSKFASGLHVKFSTDTGKTFLLLKSMVPKTGKAKDTLAWVPADEHPADVFAGSVVIFEVNDYDKTFITRSGSISFTN